MEEVYHATSVAFAGRGLMICGQSGTGKSGLGLQLMALGATLIADDGTIVRRTGSELMLSVPPVLKGRIEARGLGILTASSTQAPLFAILDLDRDETERLPHIRKKTVLGVEVALLHNCASPYFAASLLQYLRTGQRECHE